MIFPLLFAVAWTKGQEKLWTKEQRFAKLVQLTNGGQFYARINPKDMQQLVLDGMQDELGIHKSFFTRSYCNIRKSLFSKRLIG